MKLKILELLAVALLAGPTAANAAYIFDVTGTISDGSTLSGSLSFDFGLFIDCSTWFVNPSSQVADLDTSSGYHFVGSASSLGSSCPPPTITSMELGGASGPNISILDLVFAVTTTTTSFAFSGTQLVFGGTFSVSGTGTLRSTEPGTVPEPGTLALLGLGLTGLALSRKRKTA